jgi:hypothetical protein
MADGETILEADGLRVVFLGQGDRYAHRIELLDIPSGRWWPVAIESLEGKPDEAWPPSPPFQQLHVEDRPTGRVVLLVGMAGRTHWSAAVEVAADRRRILFDVAARVHEGPTRLGSEYLPYLAPVLLEPTSNCTIDDLRISATLTQQIPATVTWRYEIKRRDGV